MLLFFDVETTGKPKRYNADMNDIENWPRIVQISWILTDEQFNIIANSTYIIRPSGFIIPDDVIEIHGITNERAQSEGIDIEDALAIFKKFLDKSETVIAHNTEFDINVTGSEFLRFGYENPFREKEQICTMVGSTDYCKLPGFRGDYKWPKLEELYKILFNKELINSHNAEYDVKACMECYIELNKKKVL